MKIVIALLKPFSFVPATADDVYLSSLFLHSPGEVSGDLEL